MRIITGQYKGRHFDIPRTFKARPTTDFAKENIFNVLMQYIDFSAATATAASPEATVPAAFEASQVSVPAASPEATVPATSAAGITALDLFAGTGSITLELLSRGCRHVTAIEKDRDHHRFILKCVDALAIDPAQQTATILRADVFRFIDRCRQQFDFIFADPPYALKELPTIPDLIFAHNLLAPGGIFVFEHGKDHDFSRHPHSIDHRSYGSVNFTLFR